MPYTRTWSEELVAEWLQLDGYFIEISVPYGVTKAGGRFEADVIGVKIENNILEIKHIEVGNLAESATNNIKIIQNKFTPAKINALITYCRQKLAFKGKVNYSNLYVATYVSNRTIPLAKKNGVNLKCIEDFIRDDVVPTIKRWKANPPYHPITRGKIIALPDGLWLLHLIDYVL